MPDKQSCQECGVELPANAPQGLCPRCLAKMGMSLLPAAGAPSSDILLERTGAMIGRYKLLEKIGEGGFGVVFMAEQVEPVQRKVALKIIKAGMDTREVIARFEAERQAIALMDHPNIARALDAGATEAGRPFFVMELVRGIPITDYCDQANLSTHDRLQLFIKVCQAVQHAHQKGVIHRDLKPSNVLVTEHDGEPLPKVIDFGVAKALGQKLTEKTLFTAFHHLIGTPAYMSPEQAALSGLDIDTRADIYSLGVLLYELLTGVTPFDAETFRKAALDEIRRMIRETEPPKPSTRLQTLGDKLTDVAKQRGTEPAALSRLVRGDLDWIVMKCLEKDRQRRYETANELATELVRHLGNEPILACPPSNLYRFRKLVHRNKHAFTAATVIATVLVLGICGSTWQAFRAKRAEQQVLAEAAGNDKVVKFLQHMLEGIPRSVAQGRDTTMIQELVDEATKRIDKESPAHHRAEGNLRSTIGQIYADLGEYAKAETMFREVAATEREMHGPDHPHVARSLTPLAHALLDQGKLVAAQTTIREALAIWDKGAPDEFLEIEQLHTLSAAVLVRQGKFTEAEELTRQVLGARQKRLGSEHPEVVEALNNLSAVLLHQGKMAEAEKMQRQVLALRRRQTPPALKEVASSLHNLAAMLSAQSKYAEATPLLREALALRQKERGGEHPDTVESLLSLGSILVSQLQMDEAEPMIRQALATQEKMRREESPLTATALDILAWLLENQGKWEEAETITIRALGLCRKIYGPESAEVANSTAVLASIRKKQGRLKETEELQRQALAMRIKFLGRDNLQTAKSLRNLGVTLRDERQFVEADEKLQAALTIRQKLLGPEHSEIADSLHEYASSLQYQGQLAEAEKLYLQALNLRTKLLGADDPETIESLNSLANLLAQQGRFAESEKRYRELLAARQKVSGLEHVDVATAADRLCFVLWEQGRRAEAELAFREALPIYLKLLEQGNTNGIVPLNRFAWQTLAQQGKINEAEELLRTILSTMKQQRGDEDAVTAERMGNLGSWLGDHGKTEEGEIMLNQSLAQRRRLFGEEHSEVADSLGRLADLYMNRGDFAMAETKFRECIKIEKQQPKINHTKLRSVLAGLFLLFEKQENFEAMEQVLLEQNALIQESSDFSLEQKRSQLAMLKSFYIDWAAVAPGTGKAAKVSEWSKKLAEFDELSQQRRPDAK